MTVVDIQREYSVDSTGDDEVIFSMKLPSSVAPMSGGSMTFLIRYAELTRSGNRRGRSAPGNPQTDFMTAGSGYPGMPRTEWFAAGQQRHFTGPMAARFDWTDANGAAHYAEAQFDAGTRVNASVKVVLDKPRGTELSLIARYPMPWDGNATAEMLAATKGRWHPGRVSFRSVANTPNRGTARTLIRNVHNVQEMINEIAARPDDSIMRLNIFSHGGPGLVSLGGHLDANNTIQMELRRQDQAGDPVDGGLDREVVAWFNGEGPWANRPGRGYRSIVRQKFRENGEVLLFLCNGGIGGGYSLAHDLGRCFNVAVLAYGGPVGYYMEDTNPGPAVVIDHNLTSYPVVVGDAAYAAARASGAIGPGYPCAVAIPANVPNGSQVRPDKPIPEPPPPLP